MRIEFRESRPSSFLPTAYSYLRHALPDTTDSSGQRSALGIYNVSLHRLIHAMSVALVRLGEQIDENRIPTGGDGLRWMSPVIEAWGELLHAANAHVDDVKQIVVRALGVSSPWKTPEGRKFKSSIREYRDHISRIVNHIKHGQGRLRAFAFYSPTTCYPGYYIEGVHSGGAIGPEPSIHRQGKGAFSFARDCRLHLVWLYGLSEALANVLAAIGVPESNAPSVLADSSKFISLAETVKRVPPYVFPDERTKPVPKVEIVNQDNDRRLLLSYVDDASAKPIPTSRKLRIATVWQGDGVSRSFVLPYKAMDSPDKTASLKRDT